MKIKGVGRSGVKISEICLGTMTFGIQCDEPTSFSILDRAWHGGVNFLDTADAYPLGGDFKTAGATETIIGDWFKAHPIRRHETILAPHEHGQMSKASHEQPP